MAEKKYAGEMVAEALREVGILTIVFASLYELLETDKQHWHIFWTVIAVGIAAFGVGIRMERKRK